MATLIVIDTRTRNLETFAASATCVPNSGHAIVLRKAVALGSMTEVEGVSQHPVLVLGTGYKAYSSAGHVTVMDDALRHDYQVYAVGGAGFGYDSWDEESQQSVHRGEALRPWRPLKAILLPAGTVVSRVATHANSNPATADAALEGLRLLSWKNLIVAEGQSDYTSGWTFKLPERGELPALPWEHRTNIFGAKEYNLAIMKMYKPRPTDAQLFSRAVLFRICQEANAMAHYPESGIWANPYEEKETCAALGYEQYLQAMREVEDSFLTTGWHLDSLTGEEVTQVITPGGQVVPGVTLYGGGGVRYTGDTPHRQIMRQQLSQLLPFSTATA